MLFTAFCLVWLSIISIAAQDVNFERIAPKPVLKAKKGTSPSVPELPDAPRKDNDETVIKSLLGIQLIDSPDGLEEALKNKQAGINIPKVFIPYEAELKNKLNHYLGVKASMSDLQAIGIAITDHYRSHDHPVVTVITPTQDITEGIVTFIVVDSKVGKLYATGAEYFDNDRIASQFRLGPGDIISRSVLESDLDYVNKNPFRDVSLIYEKGAAFGATDINLRVDDRFPLQVYTGYQNSGNDTTRLHRWIVGGIYGNMFNLEHQLGLQYTSSGDKKFNSGAFTYNIPFIFRTDLLLYGSYIKTNAQLPEPLSHKGENIQAGIRLTKKLSTWKTIKHQVGVGVDFKRSRNDLFFSDVNFNQDHTVIAKLVIEYIANHPDEFGSTQFGASAFFSPGGVFGNNSTADFNNSRAFADPHYFTGFFEIDRTTELLLGFHMKNSFSLQLASENLLTSEQLLAGGIYSVRGYSENAALGDRGILFSTELHAPSFTFLDKLGFSYSKDPVDLYAFWDYANVENVDLLPGENKSTTLSSVGIGMSYYIYPYLSLNIDFGWQLKYIGSIEAHGSRLHVSAIASY